MYSSKIIHYMAVPCLTDYLPMTCKKTFIPQKVFFLKKLRLNCCMTMGLERPQTMNFNVPFSDTSEVIYDTAEQCLSD